jgi:hypothetical protein
MLIWNTQTILFTICMYLFFRTFPIAINIILSFSLFTCTAFSPKKQRIYWPCGFCGLWRYFALSYSQWHKRRTPIYAQMIPKQHPGRSLWSYIWKQTTNTTHPWLFYGHTKRHCHSDKKKPYRHWTNNKNTLLLSACEKNQAQCKISAMTFISKRKKNIKIKLKLYILSVGPILTPF